MDRQPHFVIPVDTDIELRLLVDADAQQLFTLIDRNREHLRPWLPWVDYHTDPIDSQRFIRRSAQRYLDNDGFDLGIYYRGQLAGIVGFHTVNWPNRQVEIGYWQGANFQGHGVMTRACRAIVDYAFHKLQLNRVSILCATGNARSRAIPERLGFTQEGILRDGEWLYDHFVDLAIYSMLARQWDTLYPG
ncbi:MAG TPA: GNAT family protein [Ktedonobacteraceae bacterium]